MIGILLYKPFAKPTVKVMTRACSQQKQLGAIRCMWHRGCSKFTDLVVLKMWGSQRKQSGRSSTVGEIQQVQLVIAIQQQAVRHEDPYKVVLSVQGCQNQHKNWPHLRMLDTTLMRRSTHIQSMPLKTVHQKRVEWNSLGAGPQEVGAVTNHSCNHNHNRYGITKSLHFLLSWSHDWHESAQ